MEVQDLINQYHRKQQEEARRNVMRDFIQAEVIACYLCREKEQDVPHPWDYYPELFKKEKITYEKVKEDRELENYKSARRSYAAEFNSRRRQKS